MGHWAQGMGHGAARTICSAFSLATFASLSSCFRSSSICLRSTSSFALSSEVTAVSSCSSVSVRVASSCSAAALSALS